MFIVIHSKIRNENILLLHQPFQQVMTEVYGRVLNLIKLFFKRFRATFLFVYVFYYNDSFVHYVEASNVISA